MRLSPTHEVATTSKALAYGDDVDWSEDHAAVDRQDLADARVPVPGQGFTPRRCRLQDTTKVTLGAVEKSVFTPAVTV